MWRLLVITQLIITNSGGGEDFFIANTLYVRMVLYTQCYETLKIQRNNQIFYVRKNKRK